MRRHPNAGGAATAANRATAQPALAAIAALACALGVLTPISAQAEPTSPGSRAATSDEDHVERAPLTRAQATEQAAAAAKLRATFDAQYADLAQARAALARASAESNAALQAVAQARAAQGAAAEVEETARARLRELTTAATAAKRDLDAMAVEAYTGGSGSLTDVAAMLQILTQDSDALAEAPLASYLTRARSADQSKLRALAASQQRVAAQATRAHQARMKATSAARAAQREAQARLDQQRVVLTELQARIAATRARSDANATRALATQGGINVARATTTGQTPMCSTDLGSYRNGRLPDSALCPLVTAPGHRLRPDAARGFDAMSRAYRQSTGSYLCVTDSYRTYDGQVDIRKRKPTLAAVPGRSNHGWGLAVDLCAGADSFSGGAHQWLRQNATLYGFHLPTWAHENGSNPEPWHWEFVP